jgi:Phage integrase, N-terminal SAM-like domain
MTPLRRRMTEDMQVRNFSPHTQNSYVQQVSLFARHFSKSPEVLGPEEIRSYQVYLTIERKLAPGSILIAVSALRFLYKVTSHRDWCFEDIIPAPKGADWFCALTFSHAGDEGSEARASCVRFRPTPKRSGKDAPERIIRRAFHSGLLRSRWSGSPANGQPLLGVSAARIYSASQTSDGLGSQHAPYSPDHFSSLRTAPPSFSRARYSSTRSRLPSPARWTTRSNCPIDATSSNCSLMNHWRKLSAV